MSRSTSCPDTKWEGNTNKHNKKYQYTTIFGVRGTYISGFIFIGSTRTQIFDRKKKKDGQVPANVDETVSIGPLLCSVTEGHHFKISLKSVFSILKNRNSWFCYLNKVVSSKTRFCDCNTWFCNRKILYFSLSHVVWIYQVFRNAIG